MMVRHSKAHSKRAESNNSALEQPNDEQVSEQRVIVIVIEIYE